MKPAGQLLIMAFIACCASCDDEMADTSHFEPMEASGLFADGTSARTPPAGTVPRGANVSELAVATGRAPGTNEAVAHSPLPFTMDRIQRGRELFNIHCIVCHGEDGYGKGIVVRRGFPQPPTYHSDRLRNAPDGHFFDVITHGYGRMHPFGARVAIEDRWAIVGYIRALQRSQHASLADVTDAAAKERLIAERGGR